MWSAPAERSSDGALDSVAVPTGSPIQSGVALGLPPHSKMSFSAAARVLNCMKPDPGGPDCILSQQGQTMAAEP